MNLFIFGGTGDLAGRKLLPALYRHHKAERLNPETQIYGIGSREIDTKTYREDTKKNLEIYLEPEEYSEQSIDTFLLLVQYKKINFNISNDFQSLRDITTANERNLYYLAVSPSFYKIIADNLSNQSLIGPSSSIIVEKPIGTNLLSSVEINEALAKHFAENQIFRIDHYLGKEAVQNLLALRFGNILFEKIWSNVAVDHIQITVAETLGLENRGSYYDHTGAIKDMLQNHLLQILCLVAMEPPTSVNSESIRDEKLKVLRSLRHIEMNSIQDHCVIGQYKDGAIHSTPKIAYRGEEGVQDESKTETFVALKVWIDNWRW